MAKEASLIKWFRTLIIDAIVTTFANFHRMKFLRFMPSSAEKILHKIVNINPWTIEHIKNPSEQLKRLAVSKTPFVISVIKEQSYDLKMLVLAQEVPLHHRDHPIRYIQGATEEMKLLAIQQDAYFISYVDNPSEELQREAIMLDPTVIRYVQSPSPKIVLLARLLGFDGDHTVRIP